MSETDLASEVEVMTAANGSDTPKNAGNETVDAKSDQNDNGAMTLAKEKGDAAELKKDEDVKMEEVMDRAEHDWIQNKENGQQSEAEQEVKDVKSQDMKNDVKDKKGENVEEVKDSENKSDDQDVVTKEVEVSKEVLKKEVAESKEDEEREGEGEEFMNAKDTEPKGVEEHEENKEEVKEIEENQDEHEEEGGKMVEREEVMAGKKAKEHGSQNEESQDEHEDKSEESMDEKSGEEEEFEEHEGEDEKVKEKVEDEEEKESEEEEEPELKEKKGKNEINGRKRKRSRAGTGKKGELKENKGRKKTKEVFETRSPSSIDRPQRERKTVQRLVEVIEKEPAKSFLIEKGQGTPLKDIPNVAYKLSWWRTDDIKFLHLILFGKKGKAIDFKNHISQFSGFVWHGNEDKQRAKVKEKLDKCIKDKLLDLCDVFDIHVSRTTTKKEELVTQILDFLVSPRPLTDILLEDKEQHSSRSRKRKGSTRGRASRSAGSLGKRPRKRQAKGENTPKSAERNILASESEDEDEHEEPTLKDHHHEHEDAKPSDSEKENESVKDGAEDKHDEDSESSEETKKSTKRKGSAGRMKSKKVTPPTKSAAPTAAKTAIKTPSSKRSKTEETNGPKEKVFSRKKKVVETSQKKIISKLDSKAKNSGIGRSVGRGKGKTLKTEGSLPSKEELRKTICEILKEVDFNTATFTDILKQLANHFHTDLTPKKVAIKLMIQEELTKLAEADDENEEDEDDEENGGKEGDEKPNSKVKV